MQINRLTSREVETIKRDGVHADGGGLYLRVRGAARNWLFVYRWQEKRRELGLGAPPTIGVKKARERAQAARDLLADGKDPIAEKRALRALPLFGVLADQWVEDRKASVRNEKSVDRWNRVLAEKGYAAALRPLRVDRITTEDVLAVLKPIWAKGPTATLARGYIEAVLDAAKAAGLRTGDNPARWRGHLDHLLPRPAKLERGHHKAMAYADVPDFMAALRERESTVARLLEFTILTAARSGEAVGATWGEFDLDAALWTVPAERMKAGREHRVPLSPRAVTVLRALLPDDAEPGAAVFGDKGRAPSNMAAPMLLRRMGSDATVHGFRSAFRDYAGDRTNFPREVAEAALAHSLGGVEAAYRRADALQKRRKLMESWANFCAAPAGGNVRQLRRA